MCIYLSVYLKTVEWVTETAMLTSVVCASDLCSGCVCSRRHSLLLCLLQVATAAVTASYTISNLNPGTVYYVSVGATNSVGTRYISVPLSAAPSLRTSFVFSPGAPVCVAHQQLTHAHAFLALSVSGCVSCLHTPPPVNPPRCRVPIHSTSALVLSFSLLLFCCSRSHLSSLRRDPWPAVLRPAEHA